MAQTQPTGKNVKFHDHNESCDILSVVNNIQEERKLFTFTELKLKYSEFFTMSPQLFKKCYDTELSQDEREELAFILDIRERVKSKEISFHDANFIIPVYMGIKHDNNMLPSLDRLTVKLLKFLPEALASKLNSVPINILQTLPLETLEVLPTDVIEKIIGD
jgi:hypothetical protein